MSYYYAELNEKDICVSISEVDAEINEYNFIRISSLDQSIIGKWYDRFNERFVVAPVHIAAEHSSNEIQYKDQEVWLNDVIDAKAEATDVYTKAEVDAKFVETSDNDANDILAKIKTVDGAGSDLDADTLDGKQASEFATADHTHDYANINHTHNDYAPVSHTHDYAASDHTHAVSDVENLQTVLNGKAASSHTHNDASTSAAGLMSAADKTKLDGIASGANKTVVDSALSSTSTNPVQNKVINSALAGKAASSHTHSGYAASNHTHSQYAASNHTHSQYAASSHTHDYLPLSGGEVGGELDVNGIVRVKGNQGIYVASGQMTFGTNNLKTYIVGSSISSRVAITIASDKRLKENIETADINALADLISKLRVVNYNYIGDEEKQRVGIIAQDLQAVNPELAKRFIEVDDEGYLRVSFSELVFPLIAAVQELQKRVAELEKAE